MKVVLVAPYQKMVRDTEEVCRMYGERIDIVTGKMSSGLRVATKAVSEGAGVVISRGGTWSLLSEKLSVPVVEIAVTPYDVLRALQKARNMGKKIGVAGFANVISSMSEWSDMLNVSVVPIEIQDDTEKAKHHVKEVITRGHVDCLVGDMSTTEYAQEMGVDCILIESGKEAIWDAIQESKRIIAARMAERKVFDSINSVLDRAQEGLLVIEDGIVQFANQVVQRMIGQDECAGSPLRQCLPTALVKFIEQTNTSDIIQMGSKLWFVEKNFATDASRCFVMMHMVDNIESIELQVRRHRTESGHIARYSFDDLYGQSVEMRRVIEKSIRFSRTDSSVLIVGETGTGKEVLAQSIHNASPRVNGPFVAVNCAAFSDQLLESELFGYAEGAFTGAKRGGKPGLFELAHGGTIFLDEIGETTQHVQQRLLRVLQERQVMRIGGERVIPVNVRVIAATNQPLWKFVQENKFRKDLFFRLDVLRLNTIPLRQRVQDIPELVERLVYQAWYKRKGVGVRPRIDPEIYSRLQHYHWPGNVRELQNMVDYVLAIHVQGAICQVDIDEWFSQKVLVESHENHQESESGFKENGFWPIGKSMDEIERWVIERTLDETDGDMTKAAAVLGISRTTLWRKAKQWENVVI
jgi:transcriptional regulator with PAS, ATPase and Fis domain